MLIAQLTDTHITVPENGNGDCYVKLEALRKCVSAINKLNTAPDVVIHTGDLVHNGSDEEYRLTKLIMDELRAPYLITPGNRDSVTALIRNFTLHSYQNADTAFLQYATSVLDYRLIASDTSTENNNLGFLDFQRLAHLDNLLNEKPERSTVIFMHHPPINLSNSEPLKHEYESYGMIRNFSEIIDRHPQVVAILCGHIHRSLTGWINATPLVVMPPLSKSLNRDPASYSSTPNIAFYLHTISTKASVDTEVITVN
jgi:3',5'-cyclic AMP phosphodiesterase CpdA|tara:strand:+ start:2174 stop:2941 length:768 start_codon:yes stop_codon:yes gene_type:complete